MNTKDTTTNEAGTSPARHEDLRDVIDFADRNGQLIHLDGVDWNIEAGVIAEIVAHSSAGNAPAVLFDNLKGYPEGMRIVSGIHNSTRRLAYTLGLPQTDRQMDLVQSYHRRMKEDHRFIPPEEVKDGPILENVDRDDDVNVFKFPVPMVHEKDGGRYIGTYDMVIMRDPDSGWVNGGTYRVQVHDEKTVAVWMSPSKHGRMIQEKYFARGEPCPLLICCGLDPLLFLAASHEIKMGRSEFDYAGGQRGRAFEVIPSELHGLPIPARAEVVLEGEIMPDETRQEGPFGEFTGYYASGFHDLPVARIRRVYHRTNPILTMASPMRPPTDVSYAKCIVQSAMIWEEIEAAGLPGVEGVWCHEAGAIRMFVVVSIKQMHAGHAARAGYITANCHSANYAGRWVVVVDDDIDPTDLNDVIWAMSTRCDPNEEIEFIKRAWSTPLDPMLRKPPWVSSRAIVDACRPHEWKDEFPPVASASHELRRSVEEKWMDQLVPSRRS